MQLEVPIKETPAICSLNPFCLLTREKAPESLPCHPDIFISAGSIMTDLSVLYRPRFNMSQIRTPNITQRTEMVVPSVRVERLTRALQDCKYASQNRLCAHAEDHGAVFVSLHVPQQILQIRTSRSVLSSESLNAALQEASSLNAWFFLSLHSLLSFNKCLWLS